MYEKSCIEMIELKDLVPTEDNPRFVDDGALDSLAASIRRHGVLQPLVARPHPTRKGKYDLRCGHRRLKAARIVKLKAVPVIVRDLDDREAMEVTVTENLQRSDLHPLEEADGINLLLDRAGWDHAAVADHLGKSPQWVARRASLKNLTETWRKAALDPDSAVHSWPVGHLEMIARLRDEDQEDIYTRTFDVQTWMPCLSELQQITTDKTRKLRAVPWKTSDETLVPEAGACDACPKRSSCQPLLFDEDDRAANRKKRKPSDRCLDAECFTRKLWAYMGQREAARRKQYDGLILVECQGAYHEPPADRALSRRLKPALKWYEYERVKKSTPGAKPALITQGNGLGTLIWIQPKKSIQPTAPGNGGSSDGSAVDKPAPLKERREKLETRRLAFVRDRVREQLEKMGHEGDGIEAMPAAQSAECVLDVLLAFSMDVFVRCVTPECPFRGRELMRHLLTLTQEERLAMGARMVALTLADHFRDDTLNLEPELREVCDLAGIDLDALRAKAAEEIPEPKSWARLKADGTPKAQKVTGKKKAGGNGRTVRKVRKVAAQDVA